MEKINTAIYDFMKLHGNTITTKQIEDLGFSRMLAGKYVNNGLLKRVREGVYMLPNVEHDKIYTLGLRSDKIIFSHLTALYLNKMLSEPSKILYSTIPIGTRFGKSMTDQCKFYHISPTKIDIGSETINTSYGNPVRCYNVERTICDLVRNEEDFGVSLIQKYVKIYFKDSPVNLNLLQNYAGIFRIEIKLQKIIENCI